MNKQEKINELLTRCVDEVIHKKSLEQKLLGKKKLRVKLGIDPTSPNLHIGRAVALWKLRAFQDLGHTVVFIIGDFTGQIGDTSDKEAERPMLSESDIKANLKTYLQQAYKILDKDKTEFHYNSKWLKKLGFAEIGFLANQFSLHDFSARENIKKRLDAGKRVSLRELLYPLMQGYDSVAIKADVELGGTDQRFNVLAGRVIQEAYKMPAQDVLMMSLLEGTDGRKMSSSWGNTINLLDVPNDMFGKVMSIDDALIEKYFIYATQLRMNEIKEIIKRNKNPRDSKLALAEEIVRIYHSEKLAGAAKDAWLAQFSSKALPDDIENVTVKPGEYAIVDLLVDLKLATSKSEARRLVDQGGVKVNQEKFSATTIEIKKQHDLVLQVGKRKFVKIN